LRKAETSLDGSLVTVRPKESRLEVEDVGTNREDRGALLVIEAQQHEGNVCKGR
jgi:hypothetical protein